LKRVLGPLFLLWTGVILVLYYAVQKPGLLHASAGLADTFWTLLVTAIILFNAYGSGKRILHLFKFEAQDSIEFLLLSLGVGLGTLALLGLFFSTIQLARTKILTIFQVGLAIYYVFRNDFKTLRVQVQALASKLNLSFSQYSFAAKISFFLLLAFSFLLTLVPPFEAFDALSYHLAQPARILQDGGLRAIDLPLQFWFPNLTENVYLWALGMGSERASQLLHFSWAVLSTLLLWYWTSKVWDNEISRKTLLLLATMPSLPLVASWAYADMTLVYYSIAALYAFVHYRITKTNSWLFVVALMSGFAMSVKYTSLTVPVTCGLLLLLHRPLTKSISNAVQFSILSIMTALPYYIRNTVLMDNPFYPFVFGGRFWDDFHAAWLADAGTGIGWNALQLFLLPLNTLLGHRDANFFDGRMGPLFLILAPFALWVFFRQARLSSRLAYNPYEAAGWSLLSIGVFSLFSFAAWSFGVINSSGLWQSRLLFPALIPFAIPSALAWDSLKQFDTAKLRISFLTNALVGIVVVLTLTDTGIFVLQRNPFAVALGAQSREQYIARIDPSYAALMNRIAELPADAFVYSLFEPRSYGLARTIQPDPINANFAHDVYLYQTPDAILRQWKAKQYTHVMVYERGLDFAKGAVKFTPDMQKALQATLARLILISQTPDHIYSLYKIP
jgi:hypothetical protein